MDELRSRERACIAALKFLIPPHPTGGVAGRHFWARDSRRYAHPQRVSNFVGVLRLEARRPWHTRTLESKFSRGPPKYRLGRILCRWTERLAGAFSAAARSHHLVWAGNYKLSWEEVLKIAPRWRSLGFEFTASRCLVSRLAECQLESLEALALTIPSNTDPSPVLVFIVPRLRKSSLRIHSDALPILSLPWAQLTDFTFTCHRTWSQPDIAFDLLVHYPNLVRASGFMRLVLPGAAPDALSLSHLRSPSVRYFRPTGHSAGHGASFLDNLSAFVLEELCLGFRKLSGGSARWTEAHFSAFQLRVPNITGLELQYSTITSDELFPIHRASNA